MLADFAQDLSWSQQPDFRRQELGILQRYFHGATVRTTSLQEDMAGGDYAVSYFNRILFVDVKRRRRGASKYWANGEPQIPIEVPTDATLGDLFKIRTISDYRLFLFSPSDYPYALLIRFAALRDAAMANLGTWTREFKVAEQFSTHNGHIYGSYVTFVPLSELVRAGVHVEKILLNQKSSSQSSFEKR